MTLPRVLPWLVAAAALACSDGPTGFVDEDSCAFGGILRLAEGEVVTGTIGARSILCLESEREAEYAIVPFVGQDRDTLLRAEVLIESREFLSDSSAFVSARSLLDATASSMALVRSSRAGDEGGDATRLETDRFHAGLRREERRLFESGGYGSRGVLVRGRPSARAASMSVPAEGSLLDLSVSAVCNSPDMRTGRVVAVTEHAIVVEDLANPSDGFTQAHLRGFGDEFDALVHPTVTGAFAEPTDLDANGRVILFFTGGVNEKTPSGGTGVVAGYFWGGDLFPADSGGALSPCASSNEGEVLYLAVPDPTGAVTGHSVSLDLLLPVTTTTAGHELQHLVNSSRRIHVNGAEVLEETWLNEGLSLMAEELLFYAATGLPSRSNLDADRIRADPALTTAFNRFAQHNVGRFNLHLQVARTSSPLGRDGLQTRGATWAFLRYAADRHSGSDEAFFGALGDATTAGLTNLENALGADPLEWMADWGVAVLTDDLLPGSGPRFLQPSWNMRSLIPALRPIDRRFPIQLLGLYGPGAYLIRLQPSGAAAYPVFRLGAGRADVALTPGDGTNGRIRYGLVRVD
jgi:hypothetical protein